MGRIGMIHVRLGKMSLFGQHGGQQLIGALTRAQNFRTSPS